MIKIVKKNKELGAKSNERNERIARLKKIVARKQDEKKSFARKTRKNESADEWDFNDMLAGYLEETASVVGGVFSNEEIEKYDLEVDGDSWGDGGFVRDLTGLPFSDSAIKKATENIEGFLNRLEEEGLLESDIKATARETGEFLLLKSIGAYDGFYDNWTDYEDAEHKGNAEAISKVAGEASAPDFLFLNKKGELDFQ